MRSELLSSQHWKCSSQRVCSCGSHSRAACSSCCVLLLCVQCDTAFLCCRYLWSCTRKGVFTTSPSLLFFNVSSLWRCNSVAQWSGKRLWQLDYLHELDIECGILLLERWFPKVFLRPQVNGLTQDELLVSNNLLIIAHRKRLKLVCSKGW